MRDRLAPMLATAGHLADLGDRSGWAFEMKWDGVRALAHVNGGAVKLVSRNGIDITVAYPEVAALAPAPANRSAVLDGEIVSPDQHGRPSFARLQNRIHVADPATAIRLAKSAPVVLLLFDVLYLDGESLLREPWTRRRDRLEALGLAGPAWQTPAVFLTNGEAAVALSREQGLEGVVAKRLSSPYLPGRRSPDWVKIKNFRTQEVVIGGWTPGHGRRAGMIGALLLGVPSPGGPSHAGPPHDGSAGAGSARAGLVYVGKVGTGFTDAMLRDLAAELAPLAAPAGPFLDVPRPDARDARWVAPRLVGEVEFTEWTGGTRLRHPTWRGLRPDKTPDQVVPES